MKNKKFTKIMNSQFILALLAMMAFTTVAFAENKITADPLRINKGEVKTLTINLENSDEISTMGMTINLPKGLMFVKGSQQQNTERLTTKNHQVMANQPAGTQELRILIDSPQLKNILGNSGAIFSVELKATGNVMGDIEITKIKGEPREGETINMADVTVPTSMTGGDIVAVPSIDIKTDGTPTKLDINIKSTLTDIRDMELKIALPEGLSLVKDADDDYVIDRGELLTSSHTVSSNLTKNGYIKVIANSLSGEHFKGSEGCVLSVQVIADETFTAETATIKIYDMRLSIDDGSDYLLNETEVQVVNTTIKDDQAKKEANEAAYKTLSEKIAELQAKLDAALKNIAETCPDVKDNYTAEAEAVKAIQDQITTLQADLDKKHEAIELTAESAVDTKAVEDAIAKLEADAAKAQEDALKAKANEEAYKVLSEQIASVQAELDEAVKTIAETCPDVKDQFTRPANNIQVKIDDLKEDIDTKHEAVELTADSKIDTKSLSREIENMIADAKEAQAKADAEAAEKAISENYNKLSEEIRALKKELREAEEKIEDECPDVAGNYTKKLDRISDEINDLKDELDSKFNTGTLTADETIDTKSISDKIKALVEDAIKAQQEATGISSIVIGDSEIKAVYNTNGQKLVEPEKGKVNIIKTADGKTHKIFVK